MAIIEVNTMSQSLGRRVLMNVYLPSDIYDSQRHLLDFAPYRTLYLLHGMTNNHTSWLNYSMVASMDQEHHLAVVMPTGENAYYIDSPRGSEKYGDFIGRELLEITRRLFPLSDQREDTFIAGLSMGGYGALRNGLKYADCFASIGAFSSPIMFEANSLKSQLQDQGERTSFYETVFGQQGEIAADTNPYYLVNHLLESQASLPKLMVTCGDSDYLLEDNLKFVDYLEQRKYPHTYLQKLGDHNWTFWNWSLEQFLASMI